MVKKKKGKQSQTQKTSDKDTPKHDEDMVTIYVMGKRYEVPRNLTIMKAMEYVGYRFIRGCGCRGGFCGACGTVYRTKDDYKLKNALACQTMVEDGMYLTQIPFYPANKAKLLSHSTILSNSGLKKLINVELNYIHGLIRIGHIMSAAVKCQTIPL